MPNEPAANLFSLLRDYTKVHTLRDPAGDLSAFDLDGSKNLVRESVDCTLSELGFYPSTKDREALLLRSHDHFLKVLSDRTQPISTLPRCVVDKPKAPPGLPRSPLPKVRHRRRTLLPSYGVAKGLAPTTC